MDWLLSFIVISIAAFYLLKWLGGIVLRWWIARKQRQFAEQFGGKGGGSTYKQYTWGGQKQQSQSRTREPEGKVRVESTQPVQKKVNRNVGDYVEYEEVEIEYEETQG